MPWTVKQHKLFEAAAHNRKIAQAKHIPQGKARMMAAEGIKPSPMMLAKALKAK